MDTENITDEIYKLDKEVEFVIKSSDDGSLPVVYKKKKPGRPRKNPVKDILPRNGVAKYPINPNNHMEFMYDNTKKFKKVFSYFKAHASSHIYISFFDTYFNIWCEDNVQKNKIRVNFNCFLLNHYYCREPFTICLSCEYLDTILPVLDEGYGSLILESSKDSYLQSINIIMREQHKFQEIFKLDLILSNNIFKEIDHLFDSEEEYMISFYLNSKKFKQFINSKSFDRQMSIEMEGPNEPLTFQYSTSMTQLKHTTITEANSIGLKTHLKPNETFHISFFQDSIKAVSTLNFNKDSNSKDEILYKRNHLKFIIDKHSASELKLAEDVHIREIQLLYDYYNNNPQINILSNISSKDSELTYIYADENKPMLCINYPERGIEIKTLTEIIDKRKEIELNL